MKSNLPHMRFVHKQERKRNGKQGEREEVLDVERESDFRFDSIRFALFLFLAETKSALGLCLFVGWVRE